MAVEYAMHESDDPDGRLFDADRGCSVFTQRVLRFEGDSGERVNDDATEVFYILAGTGAVVFGDGEHGLVPGTAFFVERGEAWSIAEAEELELLSIVVHDPEPAASPFAIMDLADSARQSATAGRQFVLGAHPDTGCMSVTQFIGLIPPGRAPDHFHTYDEVIYVLEGTGFLEIDGEQATLGAGSCIHLPARIVHCLANTGESEMRVLGVFRPAGSPAEAYYPDGTLAVMERS
jgi:mannose-6-phosphate isomerase-like protein (cupin superfamily)